MNEESPLYGGRMFRLEYGGHAQDCIYEGRVFIPPERRDKAYEIMDTLCWSLSLPQVNRS